MRSPSVNMTDQELARQGYYRDERGSVLPIKYRIDKTPDPDLQGMVEAMAPEEERSLTISDPSLALRELVGIAEHLPAAELRSLLAAARYIQRNRQRNSGRSATHSDR